MEVGITIKANVIEAVNMVINRQSSYQLYQLNKLINNVNPFSEVKFFTKDFFCYDLDNLSDQIAYNIAETHNEINPQSNQYISVTNLELKNQFDDINGNYIHVFISYRVDTFVK